MNKYEERVNKRAEEMAKLRFPNVVRMIEYGSIFYKKSWIPDYVEPMIPLARLSVQREAEGVKTGMVAALFWGLNETNIHAKLEHDGLIPPKTETE